MRISGIASGFDTDEMVKNLMKVERMKVDRFEQNKQTALWRQESYNNMNKLFANFILNTKKDIGLKHTSSTGTILDSSYKSLSYIKRAISSNESAATVTSTNKAVNGRFELEVEKLAKGATIVDDGINEETLKSMEMIEIKLEVNGKLETISIDKTKVNNMDDLVKEINSYKNEDGKSIGVTSFYDKNNGKLFIQTSETGKDIKLELSYKKEGSDFTSINTDKGSNAEVLYNGVKLEYKSNNFEINGLNIEARSVGKTNININTNVDGIMEKVEKLIADYNELVDVASKLVDEKKYSQYKPLSSEERKAMTEEDLKLWDEKAKSGMLNGDETIQRTLQSMRNDLYRTVEGLEGKFKHITEIGISTEKYAKGGAGGKLQIDTNKLRQAIEEDAEGVMELLFKEPGKFDRDLSIYPKNDEGNRAYETALRKHNKEDSGLFTNVYENLIDGMKSIIDKSGPGKDAELFRGVKSNMLIDFVTKKSSISELDKSVMDMNRQIDNLNILLAKKEDSYYAKFTAMEKAMHKMNGQSGWLAQQFG